MKIHNFSNITDFIWFYPYVKQSRPSRIAILKEFNINLDPREKYLHNVIITL